MVLTTLLSLEETLKKEKIAVTLKRDSRRSPTFIAISEVQLPKP